MKKDNDSIGRAVDSLRVLLTQQGYKNAVIVYGYDLMDKDDDEGQLVTGYSSEGGIAPAIGICEMVKRNLILFAEGNDVFDKLNP